MMTTKTTFDLTVRKEDLLALYKDQTTFKLFSKEYAGRIFFTIVAGLLGSIVIVASFYDINYLFYSLLFIAGVAYCVYDIWKSYISKQKKKQSVEVWANEVLKFKQHQLELTDGSLVYRRDEEVFTYPFNNIYTHNAATYFQLLVNDGSELLIPKNAFVSEEYDAFMLAINEINGQNQNN